MQKGSVDALEIDTRGQEALEDISSKIKDAKQTQVL